jgi:hypothetical protein
VVLFHGIAHDVRFVLRGFATGRSFTAAVAGSLAIGIAATTTAFALVNGVLFRPFPEIRAQEELVLIKLGPRQGTWLRSTTWEDDLIVASLAPARRASRVDPIEVLRAE